MQKYEAVCKLFSIGQGHGHGHGQGQGQGNELCKMSILTGSSARKLKRGGANMLAGRAFVYHLHPLSVFELEEGFILEERLQWGMLPKIIEYKQDGFRRKYLQTYAHTYLMTPLKRNGIMCAPYHGSMA